VSPSSHVFRPFVGGARGAAAAIASVEAWRQNDDVHHDDPHVADVGGGGARVCAGRTEAAALRLPRARRLLRGHGGRRDAAAEGWSRAGDADKARRYFERLIAEAPASGQTAKAREWMATGIVPKASGATCVGCHK